MQDKFNNMWDLTGYAVAGPDKGDRLDRPISYTAKMWAWEAFFDQLDIYGN